MKKRLEELRQSLRDENISYGELIELQSLIEFIEPGDVELLEAAGVPEFKKKFIIVDTFNGDGYSLCNARLVELEDLNSAKTYAYNFLVDSLGGVDTMVNVFAEGGLEITISDDRISYDDGEDQGSIHFLEFEQDILAVEIDPMINEFHLIRDEEQMAEVEAKLLESEESQDGEELEGTCHHLDDETIIYIKF